MLWGCLHADSWLLHCCYIFCSNATSTCMGAWSSYTFDDNSCRIQFENAIAISSPSCSTHFDFLVAFLANIPAISSSCKLHHSLNNLLFVCKWVHYHCNFDFTIGLLCGCCCTCFHQDTVRKLSIQCLLFHRVEWCDEVFLQFGIADTYGKEKRRGKKARKRRKDNSMHLSILFFTTCFSLKSSFGTLKNP